MKLPLPGRPFWCSYTCTENATIGGDPQGQNCSKTRTIDASFDAQILLTTQSNEADGATHGLDLSIAAEEDCSR